MERHNGHVIISYVMEDFDFASRLCNDLENTGVDVWMSDRDMLPGENKKQSTHKALNACSFFIPIISRNSISQRGTFHRDLLLAFNIIEEYPKSKIFIIPVKVDNVSPIDDYRLSSLQFADFTEPYEKGLSQILKAISSEKKMHEKKNILNFLFFDPTQESKIDDFLKNNIYMERKEIISKIDLHLKNGDKCLYVCGEPGIGKSALSAYVVRKLQAEENTDVIYHFIGFSKKNWKDIIFSLLEQIQMNYSNKLDFPILTDNTSELNDDGILQLYRQGLFKTNKIFENESIKQRKLLIVIDALDELERQGENLGKNICFRIIPCELLWENIHFFITSRLGETRNSFLNYMGCKLPVTIELERMKKYELEKLSRMYNVPMDENQINILLNISDNISFKLNDLSFMGLSRNRVPKKILDRLQNMKNQEYNSEEKFLSSLHDRIGKDDAENYSSLIFKFAKQDQSEGNFLYITEILKRLQENRNYDLLELPSTVAGFFRKELIEKFNINYNDLLKQILALIIVFRIHPSDKHFKLILGIEKEKEIDELLAQISCYLTEFSSQQISEKSLYPIFSKKIHSFFHSKFKESLTTCGFNEFPLLSEEDIFYAHQQIINWCDREVNLFETLDKNDPRFKYGFEYLPYHYWEIGIYDNFDGFLGFLGRGKMNCELSCRKYLREKYITIYEKDSLQKERIKEVFKWMFIQGNDAARHALLRLDGDIAGVVHDGFKKDIWSEIVNEIPPDSFWYDEIIRSKTVEFSSDITLLDVLKQRIQHPESFSCINHLRGFYFKLGIRLCTPAYSNKYYNPTEGLEYIDKAKDILESMTAQDLLESSCNNIGLAEYQLNRLKGFFFNDYGISLRRIGKIDDAINYYIKGLDFYERIISYEKEIYLKNKVYGSISVTSHNLAHLMTLRGDYVEACLLFDKSLLIRVENRRNVSINATLLQFNYIFHDLFLIDLYAFIQYFTIWNENPKILSDKITNLRRRKDYLLAIHEFNLAESTIHDISKFRSQKKDKSYVTDFKNYHDRLNLYILQQKKSEALEILESALSVIEQNKDDKTVVIASRDYYGFWENAATTFLLNDQIENSEEIIFHKLLSWFKNYNFLGLKPRYYKLQALYYAQSGHNEKAKEFDTKAKHLIEKGRRAISDTYFPKKVMEYIDYVVNNSEDKKLKKMYENVKDRLAYGFCTEDIK